MGLSFGFGSSSNKNSYTGTDTYDKSNTTTSSATTAPTNPDWVNFGGQSLWNGAQNLAGVDPQTYVAGANPLQVQAGAGAAALTGSPDAYQTAQAITSNAFGRPAAQSGGVTADGYVNNYLNPYLQNVVDSSMADFDANAGQTRAQQSLQLAKSGALGGSGSALAIGQTEGQLARARATTDSGLRSQAYDTALTNAQQDAQRQQGANDLNAQLKQQNRQMILGAANQLGSLATAQNETNRQNIATQGAVGGQLQQIQQQQAQAPLDLQSWLAAQFSGLPTDLYHGTTQTGTQTSDETGTENQSGNSKGKSSSFSFGFGSK